MRDDRRGYVEDAVTVLGDEVRAGPYSKEARLNSGVPRRHAEEEDER
jgi:hypothetical protein